MSTELKLRRDVETDCADATPAEGEPWFDTTNKRLRIGDGLKQGGFPIPTIEDAQEQVGIAVTVTGSGSPEDFNTLIASSGSADSGLRRTAYATNEKIGFFPPGANTGAVTINRDSLGAKALEIGGAALVGGELDPAHWTEAIYDGVAYQIHGVASSEGVAKAHVNFTGVGTVTIRDSFNVISITDGGTGIYTPNWDTNFANSNYTCLASGARADPLEANGSYAPQVGEKTVGTVEISTYTADTGRADWENIDVVAFGDQ